METPVKYEPVHFGDDLERVVSVRLSPANIDTYADEALNNLIDLTGQVTHEYRKQPTVVSWNDFETEKSSYKYFRLVDIEAQLDHIASKAEEINHLDKVIANMAMTNQVIIPPDEGGGIIITNADEEVSEDGEQSAPHGTVPRLKTLLFVLENEFGVDVDDAKQVQLLSGPITEQMMRSTSYVLVKAPGLDKTILTCDAKGNVTYVLNDTALEEGSIANDDLLDLTKSQLNKMIAQNPQLGRRLIASKNYVENLISALNPQNQTGSDANLQANVSENRAQYLRLDNASEPKIYTNDVVEKFGIHRTTLGKLLKKHSEVIGEIEREVVNGKSKYVFAAEQLQTIHDILEAQGMMVEQAPDDVMTFNAAAKLFGVDYGSVANMRTENNSDLGGIKQYKFSGNVADGLEPHQLNIVHDLLTEKGLLVNQANEDDYSRARMANDLGISGSAIDRIIDQHSKELGPTGTRKFVSRPAESFTKEQFSYVKERAEEIGLLAEKDPDDRISLRGMAQAFGVDYGTLKAVYNDNVDEIGLVEKYRFGPNYTLGFTPHQANFLYDKLEEKGVFAPEAPDDFYSIGGMADELGCSDRKIVKVIGENSEEIGKAGIYKFGAVATKGFSPEQKQLIANKIEEEALSIEDAPPENRSIRGIARDAGVDKSTVARVVQSRREEIGETPKHRFGGTKVTNSFSPEQIAIINKHLPAKRA